MLCVFFFFIIHISTFWSFISLLTTRTPNTHSETKILNFTAWNRITWICVVRYIVSDGHSIRNALIANCFSLSLSSFLTESAKRRAKNKNDIFETISVNGIEWIVRLFVHLLRHSVFKHFKWLFDTWKSYSWIVYTVAFIFHCKRFSNWYNQIQLEANKKPCRLKYTIEYQVPNTICHSFAWPCCPSFHFSFGNWWSTDAFRWGWAGPLINQLDWSFVTQKNYVKYLQYACVPGWAINRNSTLRYASSAPSFYENSHLVVNGAFFLLSFNFIFILMLLLLLRYFRFLFAFYFASQSLTIDEAKNRQTFIHCK